MSKQSVLKLSSYSCLLLLSLAPATVTAAGQPPSLMAPTGLVFTQVKMTGDEFVVLKNNSGHRLSAEELGNYWLYDFNNVNPLTNGVSSSQQQLPATNLEDGQSLLLSSTTRNTCGAVVAGKLAVSLTDSSGFLQLMRLSQDQSGTIQQTSGDNLSWSSSASGQIQSVPSASKDPQAVWYRYQKTNDYGWQLADIDSVNSCQLDVATAQGNQPVTSALAKPSQQPPATIISLADVSAEAAATIPAHDVGLVTPQISELLPNPEGSGNDNSDEFIELYNSNNTSFDLSGFSLQTGLTIKHSYVFPAGTSLGAKSFKAFYSSDTGLSLSNTSGQSDLLDPLGKQLSQSDTYGTAKDGQTWALANSKWYWTTQATPNAANVIKQPSSSSKTKSSSKTTTKSSHPSTGATTASNFSDADALQVTPIHPWTLAIVAGLAVAYGIYEYRLDLANRFYQFREHRAARKAARKAT